MRPYVPYAQWIKGVPEDTQEAASKLRISLYSLWRKGISPKQAAARVLNAQKGDKK